MDEVEFLAVSLDEELEVSLQGGELGVRTLGDRCAIIGPRRDAVSRGTRVAHREVRTDEGRARLDRRTEDRLTLVRRRARGGTTPVLEASGARDWRHCLRSAR
jgi:hypothetical protein